MFWILGNVLDPGKCFWIVGHVLDSGKCFVLTSHRNLGVFALPYIQCHQFTCLTQSIITSVTIPTPGQRENKKAA